MPIPGIVCAGGRATSLGEITNLTNKHLLPIFNLPMIYYALAMLQNACIKEICIISSKDHSGRIIDLLGSGQVNKRKINIDEPDVKIFDLDISYRIQEKAGGIAQAISLAKRFASNEPICVALGDNIIQGNIIQSVNNFTKNPDKARVILKEVDNPSQYGVVQFDPDNPNKIIDIIEKPKDPPSNMVVIGIYFFPSDVFEATKTLKPSGRGELEVTDLNKYYLQQNRLEYDVLSGWWKDAGKSVEELAEIAILIKQTGANHINL